ncbi:hypothetical protein COT72_03595 [archaeon CG10_big_fil_rev_8_21_14_0_10_43_11]|nr:MAG: hypothetical protein COT72_03595 [archaeon CG10_big_fil_rev_8_21_14_0_10_43_11]
MVVLAVLMRVVYVSLILGVLVTIISKLRAGAKIGVIVFIGFLVLGINAQTVFVFLEKQSINTDCKGCNLIVIIPELLRQDRVGPYTPSIDAFFADAWNFTNVYSTAPWTLPSHSSFLTGVYPSRHGALYDQASRLPDTITNIAQFLAAQGYNTSVFSGSSHLGSIYNILEKFEYAQEIIYLNATTRAQVISALESQEGPFFMVISFFNLRRPYKTGAISSALNYTGPLTNVYLEAPFFNNITAQRTDAGLAFTLNTAQGPLALTQEDIDYVHARDYDTYLEMDAQLKALFEYFESSGLVNNSIIMLGSDHGTEVFEHWLSRTDFYQSSVHIPVRVRTPSSTARDITYLMSNTDFFPTFVSMLGFDAPRGLDGVNIWQASHDYVFGESQNTSNAYMVTDGTLRLAVQDFFSAKNVELYNVRDDPNETRNLAEEMNVESTDIYRALVSFYKSSAGFR